MKNKNTLFKNKISTNIILLSLASFLNDISSEIILPILPLFITSLGGASIAIGLIGGIRDSIASLFKIFSGYISDKTGKKKIFVFYGYFFSSVIKIFLALAKSWQAIFFAIGLERIGKGLRDAPRDAIIAESMPNNKGRGFGFHRAFDSAGAIFGSILAFIFFWFLGLEFRTIILISAAIAFFSVIPVYLVKEPKSEKKDITLKVSLFNLPKKLKLFLAISSIFAMANFSYMFFILQAQNLFTRETLSGMRGVATRATFSCTSVADANSVNSHIALKTSGEKISTSANMNTSGGKTSTSANINTSGEKISTSANINTSGGKTSTSANINTSGEKISTSANASTSGESNANKAPANTSGMASVSINGNFGKYATGIPILLYILFNIFYTAFAIPFGKLSDKIGRKKVLFLGYAIFALTALGFAFLQSITAYIILFALYGISHAIINSNERAFVSDLSQEHMQGTSLGAYYTVTGLVALPASIVAGIIFKFWPHGTFLYCSLLSACAAIFLLVARKKL